jgi:hypothetical protein
MNEDGVNVELPAIFGRIKHTVGGIWLCEEELVVL